jgi:hypothetical protein
LRGILRLDRDRTSFRHQAPKSPGVSGIGHLNLVSQRSQSTGEGAADLTCAYDADFHDLSYQASSCFRVGLTRLVDERDIRTPRHIKNRARNDPGILATDIKSVSCGLSSMRGMCLENGIRN